MTYHTKEWSELNNTYSNYVVTLKSNHPTLYNQIKTRFEMVKYQQFEAIEVSQDYRTEKGHHSFEIRKVGAVSVATLGGLYKQKQWTDIQTIVFVE
jgi:hypothetical protein